MVEKGKDLDKGHPPRLGDFEPELKTSASLDQMAPKESGRWKSSLCSGFAVLERSPCSEAQGTFVHRLQS